MDPLNDLPTVDEEVKEIPFTASTRRSQSLVKVPMGDGTVLTARKADMPTMVLEGLVPMPMLMAVNKMIELGPGLSPIDQLKEMGDTAAREMLDMLRKFAQVVAVSPIVTEVDDKDDTHLPAVLLTFSELMAIWNACAIVPMVGPRAAARFRPGTSPKPAPVPLPGDDVPARPEPVAEPVYESRADAAGRPVDFVGA